MAEQKEEGAFDFGYELPYTVTLDDDPIICSLVEEVIGVKTFSFATASNLIENRTALNPIGVFVDIHLASDECGLDVISDLRRAWPTVPVIVITSDSDAKLISQALSAGAHDFLQKPFRPEEVVARFNARREDLKSRSDVKLVKFGDLVVDLQHKTVSGPLGQIFQSSREMEILTYLIRANGSVVKKDSIKRHVWGQVSVSNNALDRKLYEVRKAVRSVSETVIMKAVYGQGLVLRLVSYDDDQVLLEDKEVELERSGKRIKG